MYTFKTIISDFERPLNTSLEDSIHMPQNHNNRPKRKSRRYPEHKHANNVGVVQATGVVPPEQRHVAPSMIRKDDEGRSVTYNYVPGKGFRENRPNATLDARVSGGDEGGKHSKIQEAQHPNVVAGNVQQAASPTRTMFANLPSRPQYKTRTSSGPIFDEVLRMRVNVRDQILADTGNDFKHDTKGKGQAKQNDEPRAEVIQEPKRSGTPEFIPDMEVSGENWAEPLYELAAPEHQLEQAPRKVDPIDAPSNAMEELSVFREIGSTSRGGSIEGMTQPLMDIDITEGSSAGAKPDDLQNRAGTEQAKTEETKIEKIIPFVSSRESLKSEKSYSSDEFEKVEKPAAAESEENGGRRKW